MEEKNAFYYEKISDIEYGELVLDLFYYLLKTKEEIPSYAKLYEEMKEPKKIKEYNQALFQSYMERKDRTLFSDIKLIDSILEAFSDINKAKRVIKQKDLHEIHKEHDITRGKIAKGELIFDFGKNYEKHPWILAQKISSTLAESGNIYDSRNVYEEVMDRLMTKSGRAGLIKELSEQFENKQKSIQFKINPYAGEMELNLIKDTLMCISYLDVPELKEKEELVPPNIVKKDDVSSKDEEEKLSETYKFSAYFYDAKSNGKTHYSYATETRITFEGNTLNDIFDKVDSYNQSVNLYNTKADPSGKDYAVHKQKINSIYIGTYDYEKKRYIYNPKIDHKYSISSRRRTEKVKPNGRDYNKILKSFEENKGMKHNRIPNTSVHREHKEFKKGIER